MKTLFKLLAALAIILVATTQIEILPTFAAQNSDIAIAVGTETSGDSALSSRIMLKTGAGRFDEAAWLADGWAVAGFQVVNGMKIVVLDWVGSGNPVQPSWNTDPTWDATGVSDSGQGENGAPWVAIWDGQNQSTGASMTVELGEEWAATTQVTVHHLNYGFLTLTFSDGSSTTVTAANCPEGTCSIDVPPGTSVTTAESDDSITLTGTNPTPVGQTPTPEPTTPPASPTPPSTSVPGETPTVVATPLQPTPGIPEPTNTPAATAQPSPSPTIVIEEEDKDVGVNLKFRKCVPENLDWVDQYTTQDPMDPNKIVDPTYLESLKWDYQGAFSAFHPDADQPFINGRPTGWLHSSMAYGLHKDTYHLKDGSILVDIYMSEWLNQAETDLPKDGETYQRDFPNPTNAWMCPAAPPTPRPAAPATLPTTGGGGTSAGTYFLIAIVGGLTLVAGLWRALGKSETPAA